jgi:hypothetical protein
MFPDSPPFRSETDDSPSDAVILEVYLRSLCAGGGHTPQEAVIERLSCPEFDGFVDEKRVRVWGRRISPDTAAADTDAGRIVLDRIAEFRNWAEENDMSVGSFFDTHEIDSAITDESYTATTVPSLTLAEYHGDDLRRVTPCCDGESIYTVDYHLDLLEAEATASGDGAEDSTTTPPVREGEVTSSGEPSG